MRSVDILWWFVADMSRALGNQMIVFIFNVVEIELSSAHNLTFGIIGRDL